MVWGFKVIMLFHLPPKTDLSYSILKEFKQFQFESYRPKSSEIESKNSSEDIPNELKEYHDAHLVKDMVSDNKDCSVESSVVANCNYHQRERVVSRNNYTRVTYNNSTRKTHPSAHRNMAPRAVLMITGLRPLNTTRPVKTVHPKTIVYSARQMTRFSKSAQSTIKRPYQQRIAFPNKSFSQKVNTAKGKFYTARPRAVNTARPNSAVVNAVRVNQSHPQKEDQGYGDSECSRHMTGNMSYLSDFKEFDGGYVTFEGGAKGGRITGKLTTAIDVMMLRIQALVDKKKVIITETSVRSDLYLEDAEGIECLPTAIIFEQLTLMGQVEGMVKHKEIYVTPSYTKKIFANMKKQGKDFSGKVTPLFETMMVQPQEDIGEDSEIPTDSHHTPTVNQPSTSTPPQKKQKSKKSKKKIAMLLLDFSSSRHHSSITVTRLLTVVNMSLTDINASLSANNLHQQCKLFSRGNSLTQQWEHFFTSGGKITLVVGTILH
nr:hypothetical protein [Tanacetum cinerariifolium]